MKGEVTQWEKIFTSQMTKDIRIMAQKLTLKKIHLENEQNM